MRLLTLLLPFCSALASGPSAAMTIVMPNSRLGGFPLSIFRIELFLYPKRSGEAKTS